MLNNIILGGQKYSDGHIDNQQVPGFLNEEDYKSDVEDSNQFADTETFVAIQAEAHNWRRSGVPFLPKNWKKTNKASILKSLLNSKTTFSSLFEDDPNDFRNNGILFNPKGKYQTSIIFHKEPGLSENFSD